MSAALRSGDLLSISKVQQSLIGGACPLTLRRGPVAAVSFRMRMVSAAAGRVAVRVAAAASAEAVEGAVTTSPEVTGAKVKEKKRPASGIMKPKLISPELREFVSDAEELPRAEALKIIWAHFKGNNL
ncbi:hypothetical protein ABZP36_034728 [Zizania latifolia]